MIKALLLALALALSVAPALAAITSVGSLGTANSTGANGSSLVLTPSATCEAGNMCLCIYAADSDSTVQGQTFQVSSLTDSGSNSWRRLGEYNNFDTGGNHRVVSLWLTKATADITLTTGNITANLAGSVHDARAMMCWEFTVTSGNTLHESANAFAFDDAIDHSSLAISGLPSQEYLFLRATGKNLRGTAVAYTPTASYTEMATATADTGGGATSTEAQGEFIIATATTHTSNPSTTDSTGISAHLFIALEEVSETIGCDRFRLQDGSGIYLLEAGADGYLLENATGCGGGGVIVNQNLPLMGVGS